ncbi:MAG: chemotaxis protein CheW [Algicola sp.]|nr:chemotaxis protein CheW [Algicola sp.]
MSKSGFASEKVMRSYLDALLIEEDEQQALAQPDEAELRPVARLLEKVNVIEQPARAKAVEKIKAKVIAKPVTAAQLANKIAPPPKAEVEEKEYRKGEFQALFFDVAGLTVAVPLTELGGIHNMGKLNTLIGKPDWFMGVMVHRENKLSIVNTAKWVMPEKYDEMLENNLEYQYIIMLDNSSWGLACEKLVNTVTLSQDDVKWRKHSGRRPWLAGLIKERMCALLDVSALIKLFEQGQSSLEEILSVADHRP